MSVTHYKLPVSAESLEDFIANDHNTIDGEVYTYSTKHYEKGETKLWVKYTEVKKYEQVEVGGKKVDKLDADGQKIFLRRDTVVTDVLKHNGCYYTYSFTKFSSFSNHRNRGGKSKVAGVPDYNNTVEFEVYCKTKSLWAFNKLVKIGDTDAVYETYAKGKFSETEKDRIIGMTSDLIIAEFEPKIMSFEKIANRADGKEVNAHGRNIPWFLIKDVMDTSNPAACVLPFSAFVHRLSCGSMHKAGDSFEPSTAYVYNCAIAQATGSTPLYVQEFQTFDNTGMWHIKENLTELVADYVADRNTKLIDILNKDVTVQALWLESVCTAFNDDNAEEVAALFQDKLSHDSNKMGFVDTAVKAAVKKQFSITPEMATKLAKHFEPAFLEYAGASLELVVPEIETYALPEDVFMAVDEAEVAQSPPKMQRTNSA